MKKLVPLILNTIPRPLLIRLSRFALFVTSLLYSGSKVSCPVCGKNFRKFLPYGYERVREGALCPGCFSLERHRLLWLYLQRKTGFFTEKLKVLHIAPEQCFHSRFRKLHNLDYTTADLESPLADVKLDIQNMPFEEDVFDIIICNHVLEHVEDDKKALSEIYRVLKKDGFAILQVPADFSLVQTYENSSVTSEADRKRHFGQKDHLRLYGSDYSQRVRNAGFRILEDNFLNSLNMREIKKYMLPENEYLVAFYK